MSDDDQPTEVEGRPRRSSNDKVDFGPRYRVLAKLGSGGMGNVFRAYDAELQDEVALKVVRAELDDSEEILARFRREIQLARKVTSPHVLRVHDLAEHKGMRFLSMQYIAGVSLSGLLKRDGKLPLDRALRLFRQVCDGVNAAHQSGVIHRDLKPQNVLVDLDDHVYVADFGLARSMGDSGMTVAGAVLGSPAYMSPEQVKGDPVDERADVYALGVMLFQLAVGKTPFQGSTPHAVMEMRLHTTPPMLREIDPSIPRYIEAIVARCLAREVADRYRIVAELLADFDRGEVDSGSSQRPSEPSLSSQPSLITSPTRVRPWPVIAGGVALLAACGIGWLALHRSEPERTPVAPSPISVAPPSVVDAAILVDASATVTTQPRMPAVLVFPFENGTGDPSLNAADVVLQFGLYHSKKLEPLAHTILRKIAREMTSNPSLDDEVGRQLALRDHRRVFVLRGTVAEKGRGYVFVIHLRDAEKNELVLTETVDAPALADVVPTLMTLALDVRRAAGDPDAVAPKAAGVSLSMEANNEFATALAMGNVGNDSAALDHAKRAIKLDPSFALAQEVVGLESPSVGRSADVPEHFKIALRYIDELSERSRLRLLGNYYLLVTQEYPRAIAQYEAVLAAWPGDYVAGGNLPYAYASNNDPEKALAAEERFTREHPHDSTNLTNVPSYLLIAGRFEDALRAANDALAQTATPQSALLDYAAMSAYSLGKRDEAMKAVAEERAIDASASLQLEADIALAESRYADVHDLVVKGLAIDKKNGTPDLAEQKNVLLAEAELGRNHLKDALAAARKVKQDPMRRYLACVVRIHAKDVRGALAEATDLARDTTATARAFAKLIQAEAARMRDKPDDAIALATESIALSDRWYGHFLLAQAHLDAGHKAKALAELKICVGRHGEVVAYEMYSSLHYWPRIQDVLADAERR